MKAAYFAKKERAVCAKHADNNDNGEGIVNKNQL
jgi:hypothetical protein